MKNALRMALLVSAASLALGCVGGTTDDTTGRLAIPLGAVGPDGTLYRLEATIEVDGMPYTIGSDDAMVYYLDLPVGSDPTIELMDGWVLSRDDAGVLTPVEASLISPNPVIVHVRGHSTVFVDFVFAVGEMNLLFSALESDEGNVGVTFSVDDLMNGVGLCPPDQHCIAGLARNVHLYDAGLPLGPRHTTLPFAVSFEAAERETYPASSTIYDLRVTGIYFDLDATETLNPDEIAALAYLAAYEPMLMGYTESSYITLDVDHLFFEATDSDMGEGMDMALDIWELSTVEAPDGRHILSTSLGQFGGGPFHIHRWDATSDISFMAGPPSYPSDVPNAYVIVP
jgi:hypothetical protein